MEAIRCFKLAVLYRFKLNVGGNSICLSLKSRKKESKDQATKLLLGSLPQHVDVVVSQMTSEIGNQY